MHVRAGTRKLAIGKRTLIMGIVNVSPDSFSGDGIADVKRANQHVETLMAEGADILDIGGESTRPGSESITAEAELRRVLPVVRHAIKAGALVSVDTYKAQVAAAVLDEGVHIINDISGLVDQAMAPLVAQHQAGLIIMHMQGTPKTMQQEPHYADVIAEINQFFVERIKRAHKAGIADDQIVLDPGIGFGKTVDHNVTILRHLAELKQPWLNRGPTPTNQTTASEKNRGGTSTLPGYHYPLLVGSSRKTFIGKITGKENPQDRLWGTAASVALAIAYGASIVRVHDVAQMKDVVAVADRMVKV